MNFGRRTTATSPGSPDGNREEFMSLSYTMCTSTRGVVLQREQVKEMRLRKGYCPTCPGEPVQLYDIKKNRLNPLWSSKIPRTVKGECIEGQCIACHPRHPQLAPKKRKKKRKKPKEEKVPSSRQVQQQQQQQQTTEPAQQRQTRPQVPGYGETQPQAPTRPSSQQQQSATSSRHIQPQPTSPKPTKPTWHSSSSPQQQTTEPSQQRQTQPQVPGYGERQPQEPTRPSSQQQQSTTSCSHIQPQPTSPKHSKPTWQSSSSPRQSTSSRHLQPHPTSPRQTTSSRHVQHQTSTSTSPKACKSTRQIHQTMQTGQLQSLSKKPSTRHVASRSATDISFVPDAQAEQHRQSAHALFAHANSHRNNVATNQDIRLDDMFSSNVAASAETARPAAEVTNAKMEHVLLEHDVQESASAETPPSAEDDVYSVGSDEWEISFQVTDDDVSVMAESFYEECRQDRAVGARGAQSSELTQPELEHGNLHRTLGPPPVYNEEEEGTTSMGTIQEEKNVETTLSEIENLVNEGYGNTQFTLDVLLNSMKEHRDAAPIQEFCLSTIWTLCKDSDSNKSIVINSSAPDDILSAMHKHVSSTTIQERGCGTLWSLSVLEENRITLARAGAIARIIRALVDHAEDEDLVRTALGALRTLSPEPQVRGSLQPLQGKSRVVRAMALHRSVSSIQRDGIAFLSNASVDMENMQVSVSSFDEMDVIVKAMGAHMTNVSVMSAACFALKNLTLEERNIDTLRECDGIDDLLRDAAQSATRGCRRDANDIRSRLEQTPMSSQSMDESRRSSQSSLRSSDTNMREQMQREMSLSNTNVDAMLNILQERDVPNEVTVHALQSLLTLASESSSCQSRLVDTGGIAKIVAVMKRDTSSRVQEHGCRLLGCLGEKAGNSRSAVIGEGGCVAIVDAMEQYHGDTAVQIAAFEALKVLSADFECWFELEKSGGISVVQEVLSENLDSAALQREGTEILTNFSVWGM